MKAFLVTGTDTGVGKTVIGCGLAATFTDREHRVGVLKPAETGCALRDGVLYPDDAARLAAFARSTLPLDRLCPYRFALPVAPSVAAEQVGLTIDPAQIIALFQDLAAQHDITIVEGAGGLLVPLVGRYTFADLARDLQIPIVVVVGSKLGALNHALLTFHCIQTRSLSLRGYILNHPTPAADPAIQTNPRTLAQLTDVPCLGTIPFLPLSGETEQDRGILLDVFSRAVDFTGLLR